jgi:hypothetical protein
MKFERHPKWYYKHTEGVIHMVDITRCIKRGEALVSIVIGKLSTPETAVENFLHAMATASSESDVEHSIDSRLERFKLCVMTTVLDVVGHNYKRIFSQKVRTSTLCTLYKITQDDAHKMRPTDEQTVTK